MHAERLVEMINQIEDYWTAEPDQAQAVEAIRRHVRQFWEPRMRQAILAHLEAGGAGLGDLSRQALQKLQEEARAA
jgi:formate dehydrogenase subunit delta